MSVGHRLYQCYTTRYGMNRQLKKPKKFNFIKPKWEKYAFKGPSDMHESINARKQSTYLGYHYWAEGRNWGVIEKENNFNWRVETWTQTECSLIGYFKRRYLAKLALVEAIKLMKIKEVMEL